MQNQHTKTGSISIHNNDQSEKEIRKTIPFIISAEILKYLGRYLIREVTDYTMKITSQ
jgi:hypothetical protein